MGTPGARSAPTTGSRGLFSLAFLTLFLELSLIRYLGGSIWNLGYFPNLVLIATFVGMGAGFILHHRLDDRGSARCFAVAPWTVLALVAVATFLRPAVPGFDLWQADLGGDLYFTAAPQTSLARSLLLFGICFLLVVAVFALISQRTAKVFRGSPPLRSYSIDILGSCAGIVAFMLASWWQTPAAAWFVVVATLFVFARPRDHASEIGRVLPVIVAALVVASGDSRLLADATHAGELEVRWSPYQKVELTRPLTGTQRIYVNGIAHQHLATASPDGTGDDGIPYDRPYRAREARPGVAPYGTVLVLGAGAGNDVAAALRAGATHVDAVEIDPVIAEFGRRYHPEQPYADPRVTVTVTDGRAFLARAEREYDLIVFALTDSVVKASPLAQLRLENYLFTVEAIARADELLAPGGDLLFCNWYRQPWLRWKIEAMILEAVGAPPVELYRAGDFAMLLAGEAGAPAATTSIASTTPTADIEPARDDWPFLYLRGPGIPGIYFGAMGLLAMLVVGLLALAERTTRGGGAGASLPTKLGFLGLGVAFLLLETKGVIQFSLLFGTTWLNNSLVFLGVLTLALAANRVAARVQRVRIIPLTVLLIATSLVPVAFPLARLLTVEDLAVRFVLASAVTFTPVFLANLLFSLAFRAQVASEQVFGWNLIGATFGGVLEYSSLAIGYDDLSSVVAACYLLAVVGLTVGSRRDARRGSTGPVAVGSFG